MKTLIRIVLLAVVFFTTATTCEKYDMEYFTVFNDCDEPIRVYEVPTDAEECLREHGTRIPLYENPKDILPGKAEYSYAVISGDEDIYPSDKKQTAFLIVHQSTYEKYSPEEIASGKYDCFISFSYNELKAIDFKVHYTGK
ncbi:MAG: hypothetical protein K2F94_00790 [Muribaculaceae bacterium]|nr:hypothetical protein [Muribaculaceae bacterium]